MERIKMVLDQYRYHIIFSLGFSLILLLLGMLLLWRSNYRSNDAQSGLQSSLNYSMGNDNRSSMIHNDHTQAKPMHTPDKSGYVDIKGAVKNPGIYQIGSEMRVNELIKMAGGFKPNAEVKAINLAQKLADQQVLYVPTKGESEHNSSSNNNDHASTGSIVSISEKSDQININNADATQLQQITGIGAKRAEQIITYRDEHGPFKQIEEIKNVSGFGDKMFENIRESITV